MPEARQRVEILGEDESYNKVPVYTDAYGRIRIAELVTGTISVIQTGTINYVDVIGSIRTGTIFPGVVEVTGTIQGFLPGGRNVTIKDTTYNQVAPIVIIEGYDADSNSFVHPNVVIPDVSSSLIYGLLTIPAKDTAGTAQLILTDTSGKPIISPTSTITVSGTITEVSKLAIIAGQTSTANLVVSGGTIGVETEFATGSTFSIYPFTTSTVGVSGIASTIGAAVVFPTTSTLGAAVSWATGSTINVPPSGTQQVDIRVDTVGLMKTTGGTVSVGGTAVLSTTSTVPVSFAATSTLGAAVSGTISEVTKIGLIAGQTSTANLVVSGGTIGVETEFATGSTFSIYPFTTSTVGVSIPTTSTIQISGALSTTSTVPVTFAATSTLGAAISGTISEVTKLAVIAGQTSTANLVVSGGTFNIPTHAVTFADTSTLGAAVSWSTTSTMNVRFPSTSTVGVAPITFEVAQPVTQSGVWGVSISTASTVSITGTIVPSTTSTVPVSFSTSSTVQAVSAPSTGSTMEARLVSTTYGVTTLFSSTNVGASSTLTSSPVDITTFKMKTASIFSTSAGTMYIDITPTSSTATWYSAAYTENSVSASSIAHSSFEEAFYWSRVRFVSGAGTVSGWFASQV